MARAWAEPPEQTWGAVQLLLTALRKLGYHCDDERRFGPDGPISRLLIR
jgi:hypothetical protein